MPCWSARAVAATGLLAGACALGAWAVACGLPVGGLDDSSSEAGAGVEAGDDSVGATGESGLPSGCTTVDAACLGGIPAGWQPVTVSDAGCPPAFTAATLQVNPRVPDGGCACGACHVAGSFTCSSAIPVSAGDNCGDPTLVTANPDTCTPAVAQHVEAHPPTAAGIVGCYAANDAGTGAIADPLTVCYPDCTADFCGAPSRCIVAEGDLPCPGGFTHQASAGTGADPGCAPCACDAGPPGPCGGSVTVYDDNACTDSGTAATYPVGTCNQYSTSIDYLSLRVHLVPPTPACTLASTSLAGDAGLVGVRTICCM